MKVPGESASGDIVHPPVLDGFTNAMPDIFTTQGCIRVAAWETPLLRRVGNASVAC